MRNRIGSALTALVLLAGISWADPPKPKATTVTYDVADMLRKPGRTGYANVEEIVKLIVTSIDPESWNATGDSTLEEINGSKLQITTTPRRQAEIVELLASARRRLDLRVDLKCELFEVERKVYEKEFKNKMKGERAGEPEDGVLVALRERGTRLKETEVHAADGETVQLMSQRRAYTYVLKPRAAGKAAVYGSGLAGLRVTAVVSVSYDRRFVQMKLTQRTTLLVEMKKRTMINPDTLEDEEFEVPNLTESTATVNVAPGDGGTLLWPVTLGDGKDKDRVRVLVLEPRIYIEEEERERKKGMP
jgi:hypothetical protein